VRPDQPPPGERHDAAEGAAVLLARAEEACRDAVAACHAAARAQQRARRARNRRAELRTLSMSRGGAGLRSLAATTTEMASAPSR
jgi:hypothetical protein